MFKNLDRFNVSASSTTELEMPELGANAVLVLAPASEANPNYHNSFLKMSAKVRRNLSSDTISGEQLNLLRDIQRELAGRFILRNWSGVEGEEGGEGVGEDGTVPFTRENAQKLCRMLPNHLFDRITAASGAPEKFYQEADLPPSPEELDGLAGN